MYIGVVSHGALPAKKPKNLRPMVISYVSMISRKVNKVDTTLYNLSIKKIEVQTAVNSN